MMSSIYLWLNHLNTELTEMDQIKKKEMCQSTFFYLINLFYFIFNIVDLKGLKSFSIC